MEESMKWSFPDLRRAAGSLRFKYSHYKRNLIFFWKSNGIKQSVNGMDQSMNGRFKNNRRKFVKNTVSICGTLPFDVPQKSGGERILGIPTVADRIAQMVVKQIFEPALEASFCLTPTAIDMENRR
jgi:retron-type reverse transcriptase